MPNPLSRLFCCFTSNESETKSSAAKRGTNRPSQAQNDAKSHKKSAPSRHSLNDASAHKTQVPLEYVNNNKTTTGDLVIKGKHPSSAGSLKSKRKSLLNNENSSIARDASRGSVMGSSSNNSIEVVTDNSSATGAQAEEPSTSRHGPLHIFSHHHHHHSNTSDSTDTGTSHSPVPEVGEVHSPHDDTNSMGLTVELLPPREDQADHRKCLVLDLDETLVHSSFKYIWNADFVIPVEIEGTVHDVYVVKRPGVDEFLKRVSDLFEVVVFTASVAKYGDPLLDRLDPQHFVHYRLFRESCFNFHGNYIKNLSWLGRSLDSVIIVDNSPAAYILQPRNAVPISSWFSDVHDNELLDMMPFLEDLAGEAVPNVVSVLGHDW